MLYANRSAVPYFLEKESATIYICRCKLVWNQSFTWKGQWQPWTTSTFVTSKSSILFFASHKYAGQSILSPNPMCLPWDHTYWGGPKYQVQVTKVIKCKLSKIVFLCTEKAFWTSQEVKIRSRPVRPPKVMKCLLSKSTLFSSYAQKKGFWASL